MSNNKTKNFSQKGFTQNLLNFMKELEQQKRCCLSFIDQIFVQNNDSINLSGNGTVENPLIATINISTQAGNIISLLEDGLFATGGIGPGTDTNFANTDLTFTGDRIHDGGNFTLLFQDFTNITFSFSGDIVFNTGGTVLTIDNGGSIIANNTGEIRLFQGTNNSDGSSIQLRSDGLLLSSGSGGDLVLFVDGQTIAGLIVSTGTGNVLINTDVDNGAKLQVNGLQSWLVTTFSGPQILDATSTVWSYNGPGNETATLPDPTGYWVFIIKNAGSDILTVDTTSVSLFTTTLVSSIILAIGDTLRVVFDGTNYIVI